MKRLVTVLTLWSLVGVHAQTDCSYYPLNVGDTWIYATQGAQMNPPFPISNVDEGFEKRVVLGGILINGIVYRHVATTVYDADFQPFDTTYTAEKVTLETASNIAINEVVFTGRVLPNGSLGDISEVRYPTCATRGFPGSFTVGDSTYTSDYTFHIPGDFSQLGSTEKFYVGRLGLVWWVYTPPMHGGYSIARHLVYAKVSGQVYGNAAFTTVESVPPTSAFQAVSAYPNPFTERVTVAYDLAAPTAVRVEVFDLLGRRVQAQTLGAQTAGPQTVALAETPLGAGVYLVRLTTADGQTAAQRIVRAE